MILWNAADRNVIRQIEHAHADQVTSLSFSPDGTTLASGGWDDTVRLWDARSGEAIGKPLVGHQDWVFDVAFSPRPSDDQGAFFLASASADGTLLLWDIASGQPMGRPFAGHSGWVQTAAFSPDGRVLASGGADGAIIFWDTDLSSWRERACSIVNRSFTADEQRLYQVSADTCSAS
jgi:WD40 repeat protein